MELYIDSADIDEIKEATLWGVLDGITTNPTLIKKSVSKHRAKNMKLYIEKLLSMSKGVPVSLEVISTDLENMYKEALKLYSLFSKKGNINIKIPVSTAEKSHHDFFDGIKCIKKLSIKKIPVNATLVMTPEQALLAAKAGAKFVSPFLGRVDDYIRKIHNIKFEKEDYYYFSPNIHDFGIHSGMHLIANIKDIFDNYSFDCKIISASLRNPRQVRECAMIGSDIATVPFLVLKKILVHKKTMEGIKSFKKDVIKEYSDLF